MSDSTLARRYEGRRAPRYWLALQDRLRVPPILLLRFEALKIEYPELDLDDVLERAIQAVLKYKLKRRKNLENGGKRRWYKGDTPYDIAAEVLPTGNGRFASDHAMALAKLAVFQAAQYPEYYGIRNTRKEAYCPDCRRPRPIRSFKFSGGWVCKRCARLRRKRGRR